MKDKDIIQMDNKEIINKLINYLKIIPIIFFFASTFILGLFFIFPLTHYKFPSENVYSHASYFVISALIMLVLLVVMLIFSKNIIIKVLYFSTSFIFLLIAFLSIIYILVVGYNGYSYTTDPNNYLETDYFVYEKNYFPSEIKEDMKNIKYGYFFDDADINSMEIYLEVTVENEEDLYRYIKNTLKKIGEDNVILMDNPYLNGYKTYYLKGSKINLSLIDGKKTVYGYSTNFFSLNYSLEDKTIIWILSKMPSDVFSYYHESFYFQRFNISVYEEYSFRVSEDN